MNHNEAYPKALAQLQGLLTILKDANLSSQDFLQIDLERLEYEDVESIACDALHEIFPQ